MKDQKDNTKNKRCIGCGEQLSDQIIALQENSEATIWVKLGYCSYTCYKGSSIEENKDRSQNEQHIINIDENETNNKIIEGSENDKMWMNSMNNRKKEKKRKYIARITTFGLILILGLFALFIWPTFYTKEEVNLGLIGVQTVRTHRFTGEKEIYGGGKWQPIIINEDGKVQFTEETVIEIR